MEARKKAVTVALAVCAAFISPIAANAATVSLATYSELAYAIGSVAGAPPGGQVLASGPSPTGFLNTQCDPINPACAGPR